MATPGRARLWRRPEEPRVRALAAIEPFFSRGDSQGGRGSIVARRFGKKQNSPSRRGEK
jgi:hypothetical protein